MPLFVARGAADRIDDRSRLAPFSSRESRRSSAPPHDFEHLLQKESEASACRAGAYTRQLFRVHSTQMSGGSPYLYISRAPYVRAPPEPAVGVRPAQRGPRPWLAPAREDLHTLPSFSPTPVACHPPFRVGAQGGRHHGRHLPSRGRSAEQKAVLAGALSFLGPEGAGASVGRPSCTPSPSRAFSGRLEPSQAFAALALSALLAMAYRYEPPMAMAEPAAQSGVIGVRKKRTHLHGHRHTGGGTREEAGEPMRMRGRTREGARAHAQAQARAGVHNARGRRAGRRRRAHASRRTTRLRDAHVHACQGCMFEHAIRTRAG